MPMNFPLIGAMAPTASQLPPAAKRDWRASLFDRLMPDDGMEDDDKEAAMRQGLLGLASGLLGTGGGFGNALSAGIQSGLLATNQSVDNQQDRAYKQQLMEQGLAAPAGMREFQSLTNGLTPEEVEKAKRIRLGLEGRASSAGFQKVEVVDENGNPRLGTLNGRTGQIDFPDGTSFNPQTGVTIPTMQAQPGPDPRMAPTGGGPLNPEQDFGSLTSRFGITPSSTLRTPERNSRVGGVANSFHLTGEAADYPVPAAQKPQFIAEARRMGYQAIDEGDHVHIEPPRRGMTANPFKGRRAEDEAAAVAAAKERVALSMLPTRNRLEAEGAGMTTAAQEGAKLDAMRSGMSVEAEREGMLTRAKTEAQAQGEFIASLPKVIRASDETVALLDKAINHPGRATATGMSSAIDPRNYMRGTDARNFQVLLDQLGGRAFLEAFESLKGAGQITEIEGNKATAAMARLNTAQSDEEFVAALKELREIAANAKTRALERADSYGADPAAEAAAAPAASGSRLKYNPATGKIE